MPRSEFRRRTLRPLAENLEERRVPSADYSSFVSVAYKDVLHRAPTTQEGQYWTQQLDSGTSPSALATGLVNSVEYRADEIDRDFEDLLGRHPSLTETTYYENAFAQGANASNLLVSVASSPEYLSLHSGVVNYVDALYADILGRAPDASGEAYYVNSLLQGASAQSVASSFVHSGEYCGQEVDTVYAGILRRADSPVEHQSGVDLLTYGGVDQEQFIIGALTSPEFVSHHRTTSGGVD